MLVGVLLFGIITIVGYKKGGYISSSVTDSNALREGAGARARLYLPLLYGCAAGIANGMYHYLVLYLSSKENATVLFPILSVSTMAASIILGRLIFKERLTRIQLIGLFTAMLAVLFIKI